MKKILFTFSGLILLTSCSSGLEGEGAATAKKEFAVDQFTSIEVNCNCDITIIPSETSKVIVESHQNLIDNIELNSKNGDLTIKEKSKVAKYSLYNVNVYSLTALNEIELNEKAKMKISGTLKTDKLKIDTNDQSTIDQAYIDIKDLEINTSNQSNVSMTGTAINLDLEISDEAVANLIDLQVVDLEFKAKNNANVSLFALKTLSGDASDNAQVSYKGNPNKDTKETGHAMINQK